MLHFVLQSRFPRYCIALLNILCFALLFNQNLLAQSGIIKGRVYDPINNEPVPFANIVIQGTTIGASSDFDGNYKLENLETGLYNLQASYVGFKTKVIFEIEVSNARATIVDFELEANAEVLGEVEVKANPFSKTEESPVSLRSIGVNEIRRNPGGNRDISKVVQSLPGVASTPNFRNDILIRGGSPSENRFYIDGIEIPTINHFSTQGASGGPAGMINVDFLREVDFYSGAFPAARGNALSSIFDFKFKDGNPDKTAFTATLGSSDFGITLDGPMGKKASYIFSARRSYLQLLFKALELPFLPTYNDFQYKIKYNVNGKNTLTFLGIGAIDDFVLNLDANETEEQQFFLDVIPVNEQWNYTIGAKYTHFGKNNYTDLVLSRSHLTNTAYKYLGNDESSEDNKTLDYKSQEIEHKLRLENTARFKGIKLVSGVGLENVLYTNNTFSKRVVGSDLLTINYDSRLTFWKYNFFVQASKSFVNDRLTLSIGTRADGASYSKEMSNLFQQFSPRASATFALTPAMSINFNAGLYYQLPSLTVMGYKVGDDFVNKDNGLKYINVKHLVAGWEYNTKSNTKISVEGFLKDYNDYPFLLDDSISLANLGADFGVIGDSEVSSNSEGRTYGLEMLLQQKLFKGFYGIASYTLSWSEFKNKFNEFSPSSWDSRHILNLVAGKKFKKNWELGLNWRISSGVPFTPFDVPTSSLIAIWDIRNEAIPDYNSLNSERIKPVHELDIRLDKKWFFKKWNLNIFLDIENFYNSTTELRPNLILDTDVNGEGIINPTDPSRYELKELQSTSGNVLPSIGFIVGF